MKALKKVEVIIEAVYLNRLLEIWEKYAVTRYTLIRDIEGSGGHGRMMNDDVTDVGTNDYIFTICDEDKYMEFKEDIRAFTKRYGGKCFVSNVMMLL